MTTDIFDPTLHFPASLRAHPDADCSAFDGRLCPDDQIRVAGGAIRGVAFALLFQAMVTGFAVLGWEIFRYLR